MAAGVSATKLYSRMHRTLFLLLLPQGSPLGIGTLIRIGIGMNLPRSPTAHGRKMSTTGTQTSGGARG